MGLLICQRETNAVSSINFAEIINAAAAAQSKPSVAMPWNVTKVALCSFTRVVDVH
jgi:hypothetical protein